MSQDDVSASKQPANYQVLIPQEYYGGRQDDEISLIDLFLILWRKRFWIIGLTGLITLVSIFYAFSLQPVYEAKTYLLPPQGKNIEILNLFSEKKANKEGVLEPAYTTKNVYEQALNNLKSRQYRWVFFNQNGLLELYIKAPDPDIRTRDVFDKHFNSSLAVKDKDGELTVSFSYGDKQEVARLLNQYIVFINEVTVKAILGNVNGVVQFEKQQIEQQIEQLRQNALLQRQDKIQQIKEQMNIARKLNIHTSKRTGSSLASADGKELPPHYSEGTKALQIKLDTLTRRKSDDPYIAELRPLQARLTVLKKAKIDASQVRAFNIDQEALEPKFPVKPRKKLIAILGFIIGLMLSVFAAFVWHFIEKVREEQSF